ncbi:MAG: hypothetical protein QOJ89_4896 [bacterium]
MFPAISAGNIRLGCRARARPARRRRDGVVLAGGPRQRRIPARDRRLRAGARAARRQARAVARARRPRGRPRRGAAHAPRARPGGRGAGALVAPATLAGVAAPMVGPSLRLLWDGLLGTDREAGAARRWRPRADAQRLAWGALASPGIRSLTLVGLPLGAAIGVIEVAAPAFAGEHGDAALGGVALAALAAGSLVAGLVYGGAPGPGRPARAHRARGVARDHDGPVAARRIVRAVRRADGPCRHRLGADDGRHVRRARPTLRVPAPSPNRSAGRRRCSSAGRPRATPATVRSSMPSALRRRCGPRRPSEVARSRWRRRARGPAGG